MNMIANEKKKGRFPSRKKFLIMCLVITVLVRFLLSLFEFQLEPEFVAEIELDPSYSGRIYQDWHTVYEAYDGSPGTWVHPHEYYQSKSINEWPEMDLENYTYIITYGSRIDSLSYKVFFGEEHGIKEGIMIFSQDHDPRTIFVYRIPKMRTNNPTII